MANSEQQVRVRFAPSPTGFVHIGSFRTALFTFLFARHLGGVNILRIEDTDQARFVEGSMENLLLVMKQLGIEFDEGYCLNEDGHVVERGQFGPYLQSRRLGLYTAHAQELIQKRAAYYCFCDEQRLAELRKEQIALKKPPMYDRHCRNLSKEEVETKLKEFSAAGKRPVVRQAIPLDGETVIHDLVYGDITYEHRVLDDQVLLKSDGFPTYHLAVVVDDHLMEITHVTRAQEWIPSTPKHLLLYAAFGWEPTQFAHFPNVLNKDKTKLSKRQGDVSVEDFLSQGYLKEALVNFIAFLGWSPKTDQEIFSLQDLIEQFDLSKINKAGGVFDLDKLDWMNAQYIRAMDLDKLVDELLPFWEQAGLVKQGSEVRRDYLKRIAGLERERLKKLSEIGERTVYFFRRPEFDSALLTWKKSTPQDAKEKLNSLAEFLAALPDDQFEPAQLEEKIKAFIADNKFDNGSVLWPMRVALTGLAKSPTPFEVASTLAFGLGKEEVIHRLEAAANSIMV
jgi:nondiscriminating glutamyl-tRNA synthetase